MALAFAPGFTARDNSFKSGCKGTRYIVNYSFKIGLGTTL